MMTRLARLTLAALAFAATPAAADRNPSPHREVAMLGAGCFWGVEHWMMKLDGVLDVQVGYAGGKSNHVTYHDVGTGKTGHAEAVRIVYDPARVSYEQLLSWFFKIHDPTTLNRQGNDVGPQYRSVIFPLTPAQARVAIQFRARVAASGAWHKPITTTIEPNAIFVRAEEYHQDYLVKHPGGYDNHFLRALRF
jgi:methionine-S-sulfoxide reductase